MASTRPTTSRRRSGLHVRCTPASRNIHTSNCAQKAQIQTSCDGQSVFTVTFRCPKPKGRGPVFSEQQVRAAKLRFIMMWLPHLRGVAVSQYEAYVREFELVYRAKGYDAGIGRLVEKQQRLMARKMAEAKNEYFRNPEEVAAFMETAKGVLAASTPAAAAAAPSKAMSVVSSAASVATTPAFGAVAFPAGPVSVDEADLDMGVATEIESVSGSSYTSGSMSPLPYGVGAYSSAAQHAVTSTAELDEEFLASFIAEEEEDAGDASRFAAAVVAGAAAAGVLALPSGFMAAPAVAAPAAAMMAPVGAVDDDFAMDMDEAFLGDADDLLWSFQEDEADAALFASEPADVSFFDL